MKYRLYRAKGHTGKTLPKWKAKFFNDAGEYVKAETLYTDKGKSRDRAEELSREMDRVTSERAAGIPQISTRPILDLLEEYISIRSQKGRDGHPWCKQHGNDTRSKMMFWIDSMKLKTLQNLSLIEAEKVLAGMSVAPVTKNRYFFFLAAFVNWCVKVRYMPYNPLQGFQPYKGEAVYKRAAFSLAEIRALLDVTPPSRRATYQMALLTGMRLGELYSLRVCDLDPEKRIVKLSAAAAKNRREAWFYLPESYMADLLPLLEGKSPQDRLLDIYRRGAERIREDMFRAGLSRKTPRGNLDFHSLRATFATLLNEYGEDIKVIQDLMRHSSPILTIGRYTKSNEERQRSTVDKLANLVPGQATQSQQPGNTRGTQGEKSANA